MKLFLVCEVCNSFRSITKENEHYLLITEAVICADCHYTSPIPKELKNMLRRERGMSEI